MTMPLPSGIGIPPKEEPKDPSQKPSPKRHYIPRAVRCSACKKVGLAAWEDGFDVKRADRLMNGRTIRGVCGYCRRTSVEFIPIPHLSMSDAKELQYLYQIQDTLGKVAEQGIEIRKDSLIMPWKKVEDLNRQAQERERFEAELRRQAQ